MSPNQLLLEYGGSRVKMIDELEKRGKSSPDFYKLRLEKHIPIFFYDDFKRGLQYNHVLHDEKTMFLGNAKTCSDNFVMKNAHYPVVFTNNIKISPSRGAIYGEVYIVSPEMLLEIDNIKANGIMTVRQKKFVWLENQTIPLKNNKEGHPSIECWMYMGTHWWDDFKPTTMPIIRSNNNVNKRHFMYFGQSKEDETAFGHGHDLEQDYRDWWQQQHARNGYV